jgi:hypothetical protein
VVKPVDVIAIAQLPGSIVGRGDLMGALHNFTTSARFTDHIKASRESLTRMQDTEMSCQHVLCL